MKDREICVFSDCRSESFQGELDDFLKESIETARKVAGRYQGGIYVTKATLEEILTTKFNEILMKEGIVEEELFLCERYLAQVLGKMATEVPKSYYPVDYFLEGIERSSSEAFRKGGDVCSAVCILFRDFGNHRSMKIDDFFRMGGFLYRQHFVYSGRPIGLMMSRNFKNAIAVAQMGIAGL
jgi:hypothetical protein